MNAEDDKVLRRAALKSGEIVDKGRLGSDTMRDAFEAWDCQEFCIDAEHYKQVNGTYVDAPIRNRWLTWQAAQSQPAPPAQPSNSTWKLVPVEPTEEMIEAGRHVKRMRLLDSVKAIREGRDPDELMGKTAGAEYRAMLEIAPAPPVPQTVQEIMRLLNPYVWACMRINETPESEDAAIELFKPLEATLTALVEKNHELQFSLDGVNSTRPAPNMNTMQAIYAKAWMRAADWANRHDLHSDVGSPEYLKDMAIELAEFADTALDGVNAMRRPLKSDGGMADEYQRWIDFYYAGNGDYAEFLRSIEPEQGESHER